MGAAPRRYRLLALFLGGRCAKDKKDIAANSAAPTNRDNCTKYSPTKPWATLTHGATPRERAVDMELASSGGRIPRRSPRVAQASACGLTERPANGLHSTAANRQITVL
jgi:hypothetical protein